MKTVDLDDIRNILFSNILFDQHLYDISDETLKQYKLVEDLGIDSLDRILFFQKLENKPYLSIIDIEVWNWNTIQDVLNWYQNK